MSAPNGNGDSAAKRRADKLTEELGIELWAKYPLELLEFRMDRPPEDPVKRAHWKPVHGPKTRVYATYMRYSWCWPICLPYAVLTDERDEILRDSKGRPLALTEERVSEMLGLSKQRVSAVVLDLLADKLIRTQVVPGRQHSLAVFIEAKPCLTEQERRDKSTLDATGLKGPRLEPAVLRRFSSLLKQLGADDELITLPQVECEALNLEPYDKIAGNGHVRVRVRDYSTYIWRQILDNRTEFLEALKKLRYSERQGYSDMATRVRNLISQRESPEGSIAAAASSAAPAPAAAEKTAPMKRSATATPLPDEDQPATHGEYGYGGYGNPVPDSPAPAEADEAGTLVDALKLHPHLHPVTVAAGLRILYASRQHRPDCTLAEIVNFVHQVAAAIHRRRNVDNPLGLAITLIPQTLRDELDVFRSDNAQRAAAPNGGNPSPEYLDDLWARSDDAGKRELEALHPEHFKKARGGPTDPPARSAILDAIPQELIDRLNDLPTPALLESIEVALAGAPPEKLYDRIRLRWRSITSLGLLLGLAYDVGRAWAASGKARAPASDEREREREELAKARAIELAKATMTDPNATAQEREWAAAILNQGAKGAAT